MVSHVPRDILGAFMFKTDRQDRIKCLLLMLQMMFINLILSIYLREEVGLKMLMYMNFRAVCMHLKTLL